ncbi:MAG: DNA/RNA nuclease SfsA [Clostridia bacterium]|nr:DNA/RNA nuclease SfsA [Clostridia bacterium]
MKYKNIVEGVFSDRPNRFIAHCLIDGKEEICHVKNTGRCKELLVKGATVYLQKSENPNRKTKYDLIAVQKGDRLINMDSQIVNYVALEYLPNLFENIIKVKPEYKFGNSRFDIYIETKRDKIFVEVKGVTLENDGVVSFPDAPTERGMKHLKELQKAVTEGYKAYVLFVVQMSDVKYFEPNYDTHPEFANELRNARENGVVPLAFDCAVTPDSIEIRKPILIKL